MPSRSFLCGDALSPTLPSPHPGVPHIEALLHQAQLLMQEPAPAKDIRPRFKRIEKALVQAEEMAAKWVSGGRVTGVSGGNRRSRCCLLDPGTAPS